MIKRFLAFIVLFQVMSMPVIASDIKGKIYVSRSQESTKQVGLSALYKKPSDSKSIEFRPKPIVVFLKEFDGQKAPALSMNAELVQKNIEFEPHILVVTQGSEVKFPNMDSVYHNVFSFSKAKSFDLGRYPTGKSASVKFGESGIVEVYCEIHSSMNAFVIVVPNDYYTVVEAEVSEYMLKNVPPGDYILVAWSESFPLFEQRITVTEDQDIELNIRF